MDQSRVQEEESIQHTAGEGRGGGGGGGGGGKGKALMRTSALKFCEVNQ